MSRLDRHVAIVQNKLALGRFISALAWSSVVFAGAFWIGVLVDRVLRVRPPHLAWWLWGAAAVSVIVSLIWAIIRRPSQHEAAVFIDDRLALKEKFSTALYARPLKDPFAVAAVKDAERAAENVSLHKRFPLDFPRQSLGAVGIMLLAMLTVVFVKPMDLFGKQAEREKKSALQAKQDDAKKAVERALQVVVETQAKGVADEEAIKQAKKDLESMLHQPMKDTDQTKRSAARALSDLDQSLKQQMAKNQSIADSESDAKAFKSVMPPSDEKGPVAEAQRKIAKGDFDQAVDELSKAIDKFDKMDDAEKKKAAQQMQAMAKQLEQVAAANPQQQQQMQQQMQQMGLNQQQAQQAQQLMQQAAQGDKQAQQQLQKMAQQAAKQMANATPQQQQQMQQQLQQMMKQAQAQANTQAQAQQMAQAAQQMAQAMKQQAQQGGQAGQQQAQQAGQQQMAQGKQQMQQQLQAMQAMKADAQQVAAAQAAAAAAAADAAAGLNGQGKGGGQQPGQGQWQGNNNGQWQKGDNRKFNGPNQGMAGGGIGAGDRTFKEQAPYMTKEEISKSEDIEGGKILASTLIKAKSIKGESHVGNSNVSPPPEQEQTDEVEQERISRPAQQAVKEYFSAWQKDAESK